MQGPQAIMVWWGAKRKARFNGNRAGGSTKATFFRSTASLAFGYRQLAVSVEQDQEVRYCSLLQTIDNYGEHAKTWPILQTTSLGNNTVVLLL